MKHWLRPTARVALAGAIALCYLHPSQATELIYTPNNPSFGGNPLNGPVLLNSANAQNRHTAPVESSAYTPMSALDTFNQRLQSMVLDRMATSITGSVFDSNGNLIPGTINTDNFSISIVDISGGMLRITTTDKVTGASNSFEVRSTP